MKKFEKKCVFYHGLGGEPSDAIEYMLNQCGYDVICDHIDYYEEWGKDHGKSFCVNNLEKIKDVDLIMGNSFGAHPAYLMAKATGIDLLLINPAIDRSKSKVGIGEYKMPKGIEYKLPKIEVFLGEFDDVVPKEYTLDYLAKTKDNYTAYLVRNMQHGMAYHDFNAMLQISELINVKKPIAKLAEA